MCVFGENAPKHWYERKWKSSAWRQVSKQAEGCRNKGRQADGKRRVVGIKDVRRTGFGEWEVQWGVGVRTPINSYETQNAFFLA